MSLVLSGEAHENLAIMNRIGVKVIQERVVKIQNVSKRNKW
jgi:hypothetical protein